MSNIPISDLPAALTLSGTDCTPWVVSGTTSKVTWTVLQSLLALNFVTPQMYGAVGDGATDDTAAFQAALDSGYRAVFVPVPSVSYLVSSLLMPNVTQFVLFGAGPASIIKQKAGAATALIRWSTGAIVYNEQTIRDLAITGTNGSQHCIDTSGAGGLTIDSVYILDVPATKTAIYVNGAAATYVHDIRLNNIQIYSSTAGHSGIRLGPLCSDSQVSRLIMNGNLAVNYCIYVDSGALTTSFFGCHPYNASINVVRLVGANNYFSFTECVLDRANQDVVYIDSSDQVRFTGCFFEAIQPTYSGVNVTGTANGVSLINSTWQGSAGAASCVKAGGSTSSIFSFGGTIAAVTNFVTPFDLSGALSNAKGIGGWNPYGIDYVLGGCQTSAQAQATTQYLGVNSSNASEGSVELLIPYDSKVPAISIAVNTTPAAGQTMTFTARKNGVNVGTALVLANGDLGGTISDAGDYSAGTRFTMSSVFSATSGSAIVRFSAKFSA